jgi:hypothetical protein
MTKLGYSRIAGSSLALTEADSVTTRLSARQFNTRLASGLSSEKVGTSISNFSPLSVTI